MSAIFRKKIFFSLLLSIVLSQSVHAEYNFRIITPAKTIVDSVFEEAIFPTPNGPLSINSETVDQLVQLDIGVIRLRPEKSKDWLALAVFGGFAEINGNEISILVNEAESGDSIDREAARQGFEEAERRLENAINTDDREAIIKAKKSLRRNRARLEASGAMVGV